MNIFEAILTRRSWRTYNGLRLDENTISQVESIISAANAAASEPLTRDAAVPAPRVVLLEDESLNGLSGTSSTGKYSISVTSCPCSSGNSAFSKLITRSGCSPKTRLKVKSVLGSRYLMTVSL